MCGIAGIVALTPRAAPPPRQALVRMLRALRHRGPDELGLYRDRRAGLAHARLSIIDPSSGQQPMASGDGRLWLTFNGEIYNYLELRAELEALGHAFRTRSDTEVLLTACQQWGDAAFERFNGQWALAIWDRRARALTLARDPVGIRPLHVCEHAGRLYFASEVKAIFAADPGIPRELDPTGLDQTFTFWSALAPRSVFRGVSELPPGTARRYRAGEHRDRSFWQPRFPVDEASQFPGNLDDAVGAVREALEAASALRVLRSDVTVGSYLSGGLDSSLVAAMGKRALGARLETFSLGFRDAEYDESAFQRLMVEHLGSEHHAVEVSRDDIAEVFPDVVYHAECPVLRTAPAPLFLLSRLVRDAGIKVVLTGEGADETFAGYDLFREGVVRRFWARRPDSHMRPRLLERLYPYLARSPVSQQALARRFFGRELHRWQQPGFAHDTRWHTTSSLKRLFADELRAQLSPTAAVDGLLASLPADFSRWSSLAQDQYLEMRTLLTGYILSSQGDRMLMAHSVEGRFPFLDPRVMAIANSLPASYKLRVLDEKHVVKRASAGLVPDAIVRRKKQPYRSPDALCFVGRHTPDWARELVTERAVKQAGVFAPTMVDRLWAKCQQRAGSGQFSNADNMALVGVLSTQLLHQRLVASAPELGSAAHLTTDVDEGRGLRRTGD